IGLSYLQFPIWQRTQVFCPLANEFTRDTTTNWSRKACLRRKNQVSKVAFGNIRSKSEIAALLLKSETI
ncbi:MAG: hypothetical protein V3T09_08230, partial [bacterium]